MMRFYNRYFSKKDDDRESDLRLYKRGEAAGSALLGLGGLTYGASKLVKHYEKDPKAKEILEDVGKKFRDDPNVILKKGSKYGKIVAATGAPILAYCAYKHYKDKKKKD